MKIFKISQLSSLPTAGVLKKWTNFMGGWQERYFEVKDGNLVYYKSKAEKAFGCRGSISLRSMNVTVGDFAFLEDIILATFFLR